MGPKAVLAILGVIASLALVAALVVPGFARADREDAVVRAGAAVVDGPDARIEGGPTVGGAGVNGAEGEEETVEEDSSVEDSDGAADESGGPVQLRDSASEEGSTEEQDSGGEEGAPSEGEVVLRMRGDEGVAFSGVCSAGDEEQEFEGQVPEEFTIALDGEELECEVSKEDGDGTLKVVLVSDNDRIVQKMNGEGTMELSYSDNGGSSSSSSVSGSGNVVTQSSSSSSSSSVQSNSSASTGD